jgi:hypothetical protein
LNHCLDWIINIMSKFESFVDQQLSTLLEKRSIATAIADELSNIQTDHEYEFMDQAEAILKEAGGKFLGKGFFSSVYGGESGGYVVKIANNDTAFRKFYKGIQGDDNPFLPKIVEHRSIQLERMMDIYVLERLVVSENRNLAILGELEDITGSQYGFEDFIENILKKQYYYLSLGKQDQIDAFFEKYNRTFDEFYDFARLFFKITGHHENDLHHENFGLDSSGGLVFFDPIS